jgi:hypothetical protein
MHHPGSALPSPPQHVETSTDRIEAVLRELEEQANGSAAAQDGDDGDRFTH